MSAPSGSVYKFSKRKNHLVKSTPKNYRPPPAAVKSPPKIPGRLRRSVGKRASPSVRLQKNISPKRPVSSVPPPTPCRDCCVCPLPRH
eukprot:7387232-Prymnesium_polylepis.2